jgi:arginase
MRRIAVLDAPSNLGLRPPTATSVPGCAKAPGALRDQDLLLRLGARDAGCVTPPRYDPGDWRPGDGVCHAEAIGWYSRRLADRVGEIIDAGEFPLVLGGDCSILLGCALAVRRMAERDELPYGLVYVDGHSDFRHPGNASYVGAAAGEGLALVTGRGQPDLTNLEGLRPYVSDENLVLLGIRAQDDYRLDLQAAGLAFRAVPQLRGEGAGRTATWTREQLADCMGYWLHVDVDVLDPAVMPAVDAPDEGGIAFAELELLISGLVDTPDCLGMQVTVYDPDYDPDGGYARELVATLVSALEPVRRREQPSFRPLTPPRPFSVVMPTQRSVTDADPEPAQPGTPPAASAGLRPGGLRPRTARPAPAPTVADLGDTVSPRAASPGRASDRVTPERLDPDPAALDVHGPGGPEQDGDELVEADAPDADALDADALDVDGPHPDGPDSDGTYANGPDPDGPYGGLDGDGPYGALDGDGPYGALDGDGPYGGLDGDGADGDGLDGIRPGRLRRSGGVTAGPAFGGLAPGAGRSGTGRPGTEPDPYDPHEPHPDPEEPDPEPDDPSPIPEQADASDELTEPAEIVEGPWAGAPPGHSEPLAVPVQPAPTTPVPDRAG